MSRRSIAVLATISLALLASSAKAEDAPAHPRPGLRRLKVLPRPYRPPIFRQSRPPPNLIAPPGQFVPPRVGHISPLDRDQIPIETPFSHGFTLTVPVGDGNHPAPLAILNRYAEVGQALGTCWTQPAGANWTAITLRLSFKRDGSVNGIPRIPFIDAGSAKQNSDLARSLLAALKQCTPLPFSPSLGSAIAGEIFAIRFVHQDRQ